MEVRLNNYHGRFYVVLLGLSWAMAQASLGRLYKISEGFL